MPKLFVSFLGTGNYLECNYILENRKIEGVRFLQEALVQLLCSEWDENDRVRIFVTEQAKSKNWNDTDLPGLKSQLQGLGLNPSIEIVEIPSGRNEAEILKIFNSIYDVIHDDDSISLDITHAFRSIPVITTSVVQYARALKNITLDGVYYGAFESLGALESVKNMPVAKRDAPVFDLTSYTTIIEWSDATKEFVRTGETASLTALIKKQNVPRLKESKGKDPVANAVRNLSKNIDKISSSIKLVRGSEIVQDLENVQDELDVLEDADIFPPLKKLMEVINRKTSNFNKNSTTNCFEAAIWCIDHGLVPQCITILDEGVISTICERVGMSYSERINRDLVSQSIFIMRNGLSLSEWEPPARDYPDKIKEIMGILDANICESLFNLQGLRNDVNHGGFLEDARKSGKILKQTKDLALDIGCFIESIKRT